MRLVEITDVVKTVLKDQHDKIRLIFDQKIRGGWECWLQVELAAALVANVHELQRAEISREKAYPVGDGRADLLVKPRTGAGMWLELKTQRQPDDTTLPQRFEADVLKLVRQGRSFVDNNVVAPMGVTFVHDDNEATIRAKIRSKSWSVQQLSAGSWKAITDASDLETSTLTLFHLTQQQILGFMSRGLPPTKSPADEAATGCATPAEPRGKPPRTREHDGAGWPADAPGSGPRGLSLHLGLNSVDPAHYAGWSGELAACELDAEDLARLAQSQGFEPWKLLTAQATRSAVHGAIRDAATRLGDGDFFLITYSGHGGQVSDLGAEERDGKDETWCLFDGQMLDDELDALWREFAAGVRILVISDSCHSGTVTRDYDPTHPVSALVRQVEEAHNASRLRFRFMPSSIAAKTFRQNRDFYEALTRNGSGGGPVPAAEPAATVRLISACQDNQLAADGDDNGLFTGTLLTVWDYGRFAGDYDDFYGEILSRMPSTQSPNHLLIGGGNPEFDHQKPFTL